MGDVSQRGPDVPAPQGPASSSGLNRKLVVGLVLSLVAAVAVTLWHRKQDGDAEAELQAGLKAREEARAKREAQPTPAPAAAEPAH